MAAREEELVVSTVMPAPPEEVFAWHLRPGALERLQPPWERVRVVTREGTVRDGDRTQLEMRMGGLPVRWTALHRDFVDGQRFVDVQEEGPFAAWEHAHEVRPAADGATEYVDHVRYRLPLGALGRAVAGRAVRRRLERMFAFRHARLEGDLARHRQAALGPLRVAVTGATGLLGEQLCAFLATGGHTVVRLVRRDPGADRVLWDPAAGTIDAARLEGVDAIVHLAGENVGQRWTAAARRRIRDSRVEGTRLLAEAISRLTKKPRVFVSASASGIYGARPAGPVDESAPAGDDFLAEVCVAWEAAARPAADAGVRVVHPRFGVVLSPLGGALAKLLGPFKLGVGGPVGGGAQPMSWIAIDDAVDAVLALIADERFVGPVNVAAPQPVTNAEFSRTLGAVLHRPAVMPVPAAALKLLYGEMSSVVLGGQEMIPRKLLDAGFTFRHPDLEGALRHLLGRPTAA